MAETIYQKMARAYAKEMSAPLSKALHARELIYFNRSETGLGIDNVDTYKYSGMGEAAIMPGLPNESITRDAVSPSVDNIKMWTNAIGFKIPRAVYESFKTKGYMLDAIAAVDAAESVAEREEKTVINGWTQDGTNYDISGMYQSATTTETTSTDFGTYGNALKKVALAKAELRDAGVKADAFNMVLNKTQYAELDASKSTTGLQEWEQVLAKLNPNGGTAGKIYESDNIVVGTGLFTPVDPIGRYFEVKQTQDIRVSVGYDSKVGPEISDLYGVVFERIGMNIKYTEAIAKLTNI